MDESAKLPSGRCWVFSQATDRSIAGRISARSGERFSVFLFPAGCSAAVTTAHAQAASAAAASQNRGPQAVFLIAKLLLCHYQTGDAHRVETGSPLQRPTPGSVHGLLGSCHQQGTENAKPSRETPEKEKHHRLSRPRRSCCSPASAGRGPAPLFARTFLLNSGDEKVATKISFFRARKSFLMLLTSRYAKNTDQSSSRKQIPQNNSKVVGAIPLLSIRLPNRTITRTTISTTVPKTRRCRLVALEGAIITARSLASKSCMVFR
jgi:hypothetical protein